MQLPRWSIFECSSDICAPTKLVSKPERVGKLELGSRRLTSLGRERGEGREVRVGREGLLDRLTKLNWKLIHNNLTEFRIDHLEHRSAQFWRRTRMTSFPKMPDSLSWQRLPILRSGPDAGGLGPGRKGRERGAPTCAAGAARGWG